MKLPGELGKAVNIMNRIQSLSLNPNNTELGTVSDSDIAHMQSVYDGMDAYVEVVERDLSFRRDQIGGQLETMFPGSSGISAALDLLVSPVAFINAYDDYGPSVSVRLADELGVDVSYITASDSLMENAFYLTATSWTKRMYWRFGEWFEEFMVKQCSSTDYVNDTDVYGVVSMNNSDDVYADTCSDDGRSVIQHQCLARQYSGTVETECTYGCQNGACLPKPDVPVEFDSFEMYADVTPVAGQSFDLTVVAVGSDGRRYSEYDGSFYFQVLGPSMLEADFPREPDLRLNDGIGSFAFTLPDVDGVTVIVTDVDAGVSGRVELGEVDVIHRTLVCNTIFREYQGGGDFDVFLETIGDVRLSGVYMNPSLIKNRAEIELNI